MEITCYYNLYVDDALVNEKEKIVAELEKGEVRSDIQIITLAQGEHNQLEFYSTNRLKQKVFSDAVLLVVGIAKEHEVAVRLVQQIVDEIYQETKNPHIRDYLLQKQREDMRKKCGERGTTDA